MRYPIVIENAGDNSSAYVPDLPGCIAAGETLAATVLAIREAIEFHRRLTIGRPAEQTYCQKRGGEGIPGDHEFQDFSNLLIFIYVYVGSNPTLSATRDINSRGPGSVSSGSHEAGITPAREQRIDWDAAKRELRKDAE
jgi:hypothetical protein